MSIQMIRIRVDDTLTILSKSTIENQPNSSLCKAIKIEAGSELPNLIAKVEKDDKIDSSVVTLYVDADQNIMKQIVRMLRGGDVETTFTDHIFLKLTMEKLGLDFSKKDSVQQIVEQTEVVKQFDAQPALSDAQPALKEQSKESTAENHVVKGVFETVEQSMPNQPMPNQPIVDHAGGFVTSDSYDLNTDRQKRVAKMFQRTQTVTSDIDDFSSLGLDVTTALSNISSSSKHDRKKSKESKKSRSRTSMVDSIIE